MHSAAIWLELAELARSHADGMLDPAERHATLAIVAAYEAQARDTGHGTASPWFSPASSSRIW
jgi:hypothetical protein